MHGHTNKKILMYLEGILASGTFPLPTVRDFEKWNDLSGGHFVSFFFPVILYYLSRFGISLPNNYFILKKKNWHKIIFFEFLEKNYLIKKNQLQPEIA